MRIFKREQFVNMSTFSLPGTRRGNNLRFICEPVVKGDFLLSSERLFFLFLTENWFYLSGMLSSSDDHKKGLEVTICSDNILLSHIIQLHKSPPSMSVCLLIACYTVQQDHVKPKHPGYECFLSRLHSKPLTFLPGCAELWAGLVTAVLLSCQWH